MEKVSGDESYARGMKCLKTGLFNWSKDYTSAAFHFDEAVKCYRAEQKFDKAIITLTKNVEVNEKMNDNWACARCLENIINITMEKIPKVDIPQLVENTKKAGIYFKSADSAQNSIQIYRKVAMYLEKNNAIDLGLELLKQAINDAEEHEQPHYIDDLWTTYISWMVQREDYDAAIQSFQTQIYKNKENPKKSPYTQILAVLALMIVKKESFGAEEFLTKCFSEIPGFIKSRERETCEKLLDNYNEGDQEAFNEICNRPIVNSIFPLNIIKVLKKVKVKQAISKKNEEISPEQLKEDDDAFKKSLL